MEQLNKKENPSFEIPPVKPEELLLAESESANDQTDKVKHSSEQSGANIYSPTNTPGSTQNDGTMALPAVDDSTDSNDISTTGTKKISISDGATASDKDIIEKIWVDKAKSIIKEAEGDPHKKNANLTVVKNQYKSARFNKLISEN